MLWDCPCSYPLNAERQARKQHAPFFVFGMTRPGFKALTSQTHSRRSHHYATESDRCSVLFPLEGVLTVCRIESQALCRCNLPLNDNIFHNDFGVDQVVENLGVDLIELSTL